MQMLFACKWLCESKVWMQGLEVIHSSSQEPESWVIMVQAATPSYILSSLMLCHFGCIPSPLLPNHRIQTIL